MFLWSLTISELHSTDEQVKLLFFIFFSYCVQGDQVSDKPWWKANFFVREPVLFGTWDGK